MPLGGTAFRIYQQPEHTQVHKKNTHLFQKFFSTPISFSINPCLVSGAMVAAHMVAITL